MRATLTAPLETQHKLGSGRTAVFLLSGARARTAWRIQGVSPCSAPA